MAKLTLTALRMMPIPEAVALPFFTTLIDEATGELRPPDTQDAAAREMLDELLRWAEALKPMRG